MITDEWNTGVITRLHDPGVMRHVAVNQLKREATKVSVRKKRIRAALNDLAAQARHPDLFSVDRVFDGYGVNRLW